MIARRTAGTPEVVADFHCAMGGNPLWHPMEQRLYWVDITRGGLFRLDPAARISEQVFQGEVIRCFTVQWDGSLLLFMERGAVRRWRNGALDALVLPEAAHRAFSGAITDPVGRVFCGTMSAGSRAGGLLRLDADGKVTRLLGGIGCPTGMGFTPDHRGMYHADSARHEIHLYDYDGESGAVANRRVFARLPHSLGVPDGMTVDARGFVWSAVWGGSCVIRYSPQGREDRRIYFPAKLVSSVTFGGEDLRDMYVTTAGGDDRKENGPGAGALYRVRSGLKGAPGFLSRVSASA